MIISFLDSHVLLIIVQDGFRNVVAREYTSFKNIIMGIGL